MKRQIPVVLMLIDQLGAGGAERQFVNIAISVDPARYRVIVGVLSQECYFAPVLQAHNIDVVTLQSNLDFRLHRVFGLIHLAMSIIRSEQVALVYTFMYPANIVGSIAAIISDTPVVISDRSTLRSFPWQYKVVYGLLGRFVQAITVNSYSNKHALIYSCKLPPERIIVQWNGVAFEQLDQQVSSVEELSSSYHIPENTIIIGTVCRITREKNIELLLEVMAKVQQHMPLVRFLIVGSFTSDDGKKYQQELLQRAAHLNLDDNLLWLGHQPNVGDWLRLLDVFLLTSYQEGTPNAMLEAMALGRPVLATDVGDVRQILEESGGGLVLAPDPDLWAGVLCDLLQSEERRHALGLAGRTYVRSNFTVNRLTDQTQELWNQLLKKA